MSVLVNAIDMIFSLYILVLLVRGLLTFVYADLYNVLSRFIYQITEPPLVWLRSFIPAWGGMDLACWLLAYALQTIKGFLIILMYDSPFRWSDLFFLSAVEMTRTVIHIYIFSMIILAVTSWFMSPVQRLSNPLLGILTSITEPLLQPIRRALGTTGPIDFSMMIAVFGLYILSSFLDFILRLGLAF